MLTSDGVLVSNWSPGEHGAEPRSVVSKAELSCQALSMVRIFRICYILPHNSPHLSLMNTDYLNKKLKIDEYVTHSRPFAEINEGFHDMHVC